ncbi:MULTISPECIES: transposase [Nocardia]|uniref:Transposase n=2 Tax=Nocardiaceae TaxID=85025 RepID=K0EPD3_NOCB7|nr:MULTISPECIES: helix-turn-helix domain-containing protein [Nocardia]AFU01598.1 hypothetical protein O3I_018195 [Nocardia brasiliensis ATCC 700358]
MSRSARSRIPVEDKLRIVLSVLRGEMSVSEAARRRGVSAVAVSKWKQAFLEAGARPSNRAQILPRHHGHDDRARTRRAEVSPARRR